MRKRIVTLSVVIVALAVGTSSQEIKPAPTLEVCNAQINLWVAQTYFQTVRPRSTQSDELSHIQGHFRQGKTDHRLCDV